MGTLRLDQKIIDSSRNLAKNISDDIKKMIDCHTTITVERAICRILGVDGVNDVGIPLANVLVDFVIEKGDISKGISYYLGNALIETNKSIQEIANLVSLDELDITALNINSLEDIKKALISLVREKLEIIKSNRKLRSELLKKCKKNTPELYVIVATGNIYEDVIQAKSAARCGADIIAIIRSTGQSLLDYVPYGATTEGFGGTFATQENFKIMRKALDEVGEEVGRYIKLVNYASGLCMPEIAAMGALERLDIMLNDSMYGILFRDINMKRTLIDQYFSRVINAYAGIIINTGEDNYLTTSDAVEEARTVIASQFINEQFALSAYLKEELQGLGHAFEINPKFKNGFLYEIASALAARQIFPKAPLKYMPPTKYMTGNIFMGQVQNALFNVASIMTGQEIHLLGMMSEAVHTPFMSDRALAIDNAKYVFNTMKDIESEIEFKKDGIIEKRANQVLKEAHDLLEKISEIGLYKALEEGMFADIKRSIDSGKGKENVFLKNSEYFNIIQDEMIKELKEEFNDK